MKIRSKYLMILPILILVCAISSGFWRKPRIVSDSGFLPKKDILFYFIEEETYGFINKDGSGFELIELKIPFSGWLPVTTYIDCDSHLATWSRDGNWLTSRVSPYTPTGGTPVMISNEGVFLQCDESALWGSGRLWVIDEWNVITRLYGEGEDRVSIIDMQTCEEVNTLYQVNGGQVESIREAALSSQGWLAIGRWIGEHEEILIIDPLGHERSIILRGQYPSWSPDGNLLAYTVDEDGIYISSFDGSNPKKLLDITIGEPSPTSWSPDGKWITYHRFSQGTNNIYIMEIDSREEIEILKGGLYPNWRWDILQNE